MLFTEKDKRVIKKFKLAVLSVDETAEIILFGSRARGDYNEESDYDFLILTDLTVNHLFRKKIVSVTSSIQIDEVICLQEIIRNKKEWETIHQVSPLFQNIMTDGVKL